ncbi:MAG: hypothetical protein GEV28_05580 [Actinophytocola sp.]|uniref:hypothetical protein n=1 Tax=Actinophytocola sp. TaxID=1872138 RepID=UPI00132455EB|nr:hypothetical protein [Actinophytocola sp.]MPZ79884.1 hypothetical protein [Actinophytocola sp.]
MLPPDLTLGGLDVAYATAEAAHVGEGSVTFRSPAPESFVAVRGEVTCTEPAVELAAGRTDWRTGPRDPRVHRAPNP